ncbi:hypothetical protein NE562_02880 [Butyricicoccus faecihominis]|uniref:hypothetical protein n=1 Tax=Butyricicoccus faecihominis TaxID=1712515 RepID=UPI00247A39CC|nr:hypothetical protein [Butyricicoccus faecihominis]MCQ5128587.1 hypothetical protein [Butyricicoccus faecihominis]
MKKRLVSIFMLMVATVSCIGLTAFSDADMATEQTEEVELIKEAFVGAIETRLNMGTFVSETGSPSALSEQARNDNINAYTSLIEQYYASDNPCRAKYISLHEFYMNENSDEILYSLSNGVLQCEFNGVHLAADAQSATVEAQYISWDKRIESNEAGNFEVAVPVARNTVTATMVKEGGNWKLLETLSMNKEFADDAMAKINQLNTVAPIGEDTLNQNVNSAEEICSTSFVSFDDAMIAANSIDEASINPFNMLDEVESLMQNEDSNNLE